ncbi:Uncharacterised protein [Mycobacteroides abscessus subsp. abscessus]|nr:Uncharacterised protein [Mycobacteroides abscessus subsp. abscessus]
MRPVAASASGLRDCRCPAAVSKSAAISGRSCRSQSPRVRSAQLILASARACHRRNVSSAGRLAGDDGMSARALRRFPHGRPSAVPTTTPVIGRVNARKGLAATQASARTTSGSTAGTSHFIAGSADRPKLFAATARRTADVPASSHAG